MKKLINSFKYAFEGIVQALKKEKNFKIHILITIVVIIFGIIMKIDILEWILCIFAIAMVISAEMFNTAIERVVDMITLEKNENAKIAKDVSAGAVLVSAIGAAIIGLIIFMPKIVKFFLDMY